MALEWCGGNWWSAEYDEGRVTQPFSCRKSGCFNRWKFISVSNISSVNKGQPSGSDKFGWDVFHLLKYDVKIFCSSMALERYDIWD